MKILIVKLGALGDVINTFPLVINIKQGLNAQIHWLVAPLSFPLVKDHECVDKAILFDRRITGRSLMETVRQIRQTEYDIVLDLQRLLKSGVLTMVARGKRKISFDRKRCKEMSWLFPFERITPSDSGAHMLTQYMEFAKHLDIVPGKIAWQIPWVGQRFSNPGGDNIYESQDKFFKSFHDLLSGCPSDQPHGGYIVINIGATKPANRWKTKYFAKLADMIDEKTDHKIVITGGAEDQPYAEIIKDRTCCKAVDLCGKTSLKELVHIIDKAECVISCDTGPMHLAIALQRKVIALFGPSDPGRTGPYKGVVIQKKILCSPCNKKKCKHPICMEAIKPEHVMEKLLQVL